MPFINTGTTRTQVGADGPKDARIAIVGEAPGRDEVRQGKPFVGQAGRVLEELCHMAGFIRGQLYLTNVVKEKPPDTAMKKNDFSPFFNERTGRFTERGQPYVQMLEEELQDVSANIFIAMGKPAAAALVGPPCHKITKYRGYIYESTLLPGRKVLPTLHPAYTLYAPANYVDRYFIAHDLHKAQENSHTRDFNYERVRAVVPQRVGEALEYLDHFIQAPEVSVDSESIQEEITCISFTDNKDYAVAFNFHGNQWTPEDEVLVWDGIAAVLENPNITKVGQNFIHDMELLAVKMGIIVRGYLKDAGIMHSLMYPDFPKSLEFLGSIYTNLPYWKDMVKFNNPKEDA